MKTKWKGKITEYFVLSGTKNDLIKCTQVAGLVAFYGMILKKGKR